METMTCQQLGGACDLAFQAETFEEIAQLSRAHRTEMHRKGDVAHIEALQQMQSLMKSPEAMEKWMAEKKATFEGLPKD